MPAATKNLTIEQQATFRKKFVYRDSNGKAINLTGWSAHMQIRLANGTIVSDLTPANGKISLGGINGSIELVIPVAETSLMTFQTALYDLKLIAPNGDHIRLLQGKVTLSPGQTVG